MAIELISIEPAEEYKGRSRFNACPFLLFSVD
jgi:hypothetical protein